jgi:uncharacterized OB-fold protein
VTLAAQFVAAGAAVAGDSPVDDHVREYRRRLLSGELHLQRCDRCGYVRHPPSGVCPECLSTDATWIADTGEASVWSHSVYHHAYAPAFADLVPYNVVVVQLVSGPVFVTNAVEVEPDQLFVGMRGRVVPFATPDNDWALPLFVPSSDEQHENKER